MNPVQLDGLPITRGTHASDGPSSPPDSRSWRTPSTLQPMPHRGALHDDDLVAVRFPDRWRIAKRWRREREGVLVVFEEGGSLWTDAAKGLMMLHLEDQK